jgi:serine-type D-Ala-D-Ala carboxypeptidase/endopeptidase (penicillin-binding protein 4)
MEKNKKGISVWELVIRAFALLLPVIFSSCSITKQISKQANTILLKDTAISSGHIGISIYEPATNKYWYNYDATKYFIPASNTKLFTLYAGMKYLGDSLVGLRYETQDNYTNIIGAGDPTFLHPDFKNQAVFDFLKKAGNLNYLIRGYSLSFSPMGKGWAWDDYQSDYTAERSEMPIYGNVAKFYMQGDTVAVTPPVFFNSNLKHSNSTLKNGAGSWFSIGRSSDDNSFYPRHSSSMYSNKTKFTYQFVPFKTILNADYSVENRMFIRLLNDTLNKKIGDWSTFHATIPQFKNVIHSQPSDSLFKPMMHRSDNFFAEQTLLMVSNEHLGFMNDEKIIDTILKLDLKDISQRPKWVDGSGLSRYNLFTPKSFVYLLNKMKNEFGLDRMKNILPTGGEGTLSSYFKKDAGFIYAKTGTLSNNCALSGYLITNKGRLLIFSVLANNYITGATPVRKAVEQFLQQLREKY